MDKWLAAALDYIPALARVLASATGFASTASDLTRFFSSLSPLARKSVLSVASRREMTRRQWREPHASAERWYGLGIMQGTLTGAAGGWDWFGHTGGFPGTLTRTACAAAQGLALSALTNAADGPDQGEGEVRQALTPPGSGNAKQRFLENRSPQPRVSRP